MDFIGLLRNLFGGGQKPAAPPERAPGPWRSGYVEPQPASSFLQRAAPAAGQDASPFPGFQAAPARQNSFPSPYQPSASQPQQQQSLWRMPTDDQQNRIANAAAAPHPYVAQANQVADEANPYSETTAKKFEAQREAEEAEDAFFGGEGQYAPVEMSVEEYLNLAPRQRAAVDANTALVQAAKQDTASTTAGKPVDDKDYYSKVKGSFGDKGGSDIYAPRTMAVLENLGLDLQGKDLDQYLNFSALVTADDLAALNPGVTASNPRQQNAVAFAQAASTRLSETLASGQTLLDSLRTGSDTGRQLFGEPTGSPVGFTASERDKDLQDAFNVFAQTRAQVDLTPEKVGGIYAELQEKHGVTPNEVAQYFDTRLQENEYRNATGGTPVSLGDPGTSHEYLSPQEFRSKFLTRGA